jgi:hypothetical protein
VADQHLAGRAVGQVCACVVRHAYLDARVARPKARVPTWRGGMLSTKMRTFSVMPQSSSSGKPEALLEGRVQLWLHARTHAKAHAALSPGEGGCTQSICTITPR